MNEKWTRWEPIKGLSNKYYIDDIIDGEKFTINLSDENYKKIKVMFSYYVDSYIRTDETLRFKTVLMLDENYGTSFYGDWTFFKVENSKYLNWISEQSCGISDNRNYIHFAFIAADSMLDVIALSDPKVEFVV